MKTTVLTLDAAAFDAACSRLETLVSATYSPDLVLGIRRGGAEVSRRLFPDVLHAEVSMHRPTTAGKRRLLSGRLLRSFPYVVLDRLRVWEARWLNRRAPRPYPEGVTPAEVPELPAGVCRILVVDDAVDSGRTLEVVLRWLRGRCPDAEVRSAVLTVTTPRPLLIPDFYLYYPDVLIRFPWSLDNKTQR
jgi:hypoxanthine phosphoribosyltransferase